MLGSVLRIDVDKKDPGKEYAVPPTNPFVGYSNVHPEIWAYGLRNPWRCSIDRGDRQTGEGAGRVFCGDVGQSRYEEIDIIEEGRNYGWRAFEGDSCFDGNQCSGQTSMFYMLVSFLVLQHSYSCLYHLAAICLMKTLTKLL